MHKYLGQSIAEKLSEFVGLPQEDKEVVAYGLEYLLSSAIGVVLTLVTGFFLGLFTETLAVLFCWGMMRLFAGGPHCTAFWRCTALSFAGIMTAVLISKGSFVLIPVTIWVTFSTALTLLAVWSWAPNNSEKPVHDPQKRRYLRMRAFSMVLSTCIILIILALNGTGHLQSLAGAGATGLAAGAFLLSPPGFLLIAWCDKKMELIQHTFRKGGELP